MLSISSRPLWSIAFLTIALVAARPAWSNVNLELRPVTEPCTTARLEIELYAVSDTQNNQSMAAMDVILTWDPQVLRLEGRNEEIQYPYHWLFSGFRDDHLADGLNITWDDGDALYEALARLGVPACATPTGLLVTRFVFHKLRVGEPTTLAMLPAFGHRSHTVVYDGSVPGHVITGTLIPATPTTGPKGDLNCDGLVNFDDIDPWVLALSHPDLYPLEFPDCNRMNGDFDCNDILNFDDINPFVELLSEQGN